MINLTGSIDLPRNCWVRAPICERASSATAECSTYGLSPLDRLNACEVEKRVPMAIRLSNETLRPLPVTLLVEPDTAPRTSQLIGLRGPWSELFAIMLVESGYHRRVELKTAAVL